MKEEFTKILYENDNKTNFDAFMAILASPKSVFAFP